jgi:type IV pilus assembly protein PilE
MKLSKLRGFTLIEVMIVVAVIGILAAIALPSYRESIAKSRRAEARAELLKSEGWLERFYTDNNRYTEPAAGSSNTAFAAKFSQVPATGAANYSITITASISAYTVSVAPTGSMAGDFCGTYVKTNVGSITSSSGTSTAVISRCLLK